MREDLQNINDELVTLRRAQLILNTSNAATYEERKQVANAVMKRLREAELLEEEEPSGS